MKLTPDYLKTFDTWMQKELEDVDEIFDGDSSEDAKKFAGDFQY